MVGLAALFAIRLASPAGAGAIIGGKLLAMAVFGAMISYVLQMASFVILRLSFPTLARPYLSAAGIPGAVVAGLIALVTLVTLFADQSRLPGGGVGRGGLVRGGARLVRRAQPQAARALARGGVRGRGRARPIVEPSPRSVRCEIWLASWLARKSEVAPTSDSFRRVLKMPESSWCIEGRVMLPWP